MTDYDVKLMNILKLLGAQWSIIDYQLAGMGWAAIISNNDVQFTLHSDRGQVDIYLGEFQEKELISCKNSAKEIAEIITINIVEQKI